MPRPIALHLVLKVLRARGFLLVSQRSSHGKFRRDGNAVRTVIVKMTKKEIPFGTFRSILEQSGLQEHDFRQE